MEVQIKIVGRLSESWNHWFGDFEISYDDDNTILKGKVIDQADLHGILNKIRDLNLKLISVNPDNGPNNV